MTSHIIVAALALVLVIAAIIWTRPARAQTPPAPAAEPVAEPEPVPQVEGQAAESYALRFEGTGITVRRDPTGPVARADGVWFCSICHQAPRCSHVVAVTNHLRNVEMERTREAQARRGRR